VPRDQVIPGLPSLFNPTEFNAAEWVALVKAAGLKYITITSKHHDGFAMFDSKVTDWDIVDRSIRARSRSSASSSALRAASAPARSRSSEPPRGVATAPAR
jgi:hypothetical protein